MTTTQTADEPRTSRRTLFGLAAVLAAGAVAAETLTGPAETAAAATPRIARLYPTASAAAKAVGRTASEVFPHDTKAHLLRRATFGPRPKDVKDLAKYGIDGWLKRQLDPASIPDDRGSKAWKLYPLAGASPKTIASTIERFSWDAVFQTAQASLARQIFSDRQLYEVVVDVFANHLHVPLPGEQWHTAPGYLVKVIRKHALGSFEAMLLAAMKHPAMLDYLDNDDSRKDDVNENLGRELLELHTVGLAAGYTEQDVRASAEILSGRTWNWEQGTYRFDGNQHVTGAVRVLGFTHDNTTGTGGEAVGDAYLRYLARHPRTARTIARKIAVRFVSDTPSASLVKQLAKVYLDRDTSIKAVVAAVFRSDEFWRSVGTRMRRPLEDAVGAMRALDVKEGAGMKEQLGWLYWNLHEAGHTPHGWNPPNGYPDVAAAWLGAGAMIQRWNLHRAFAHGWWSKFDWTEPTRLVKQTPGMTTIAWTKAVAKRVLGVVPPTARLEAAIAGAGLKPRDPVPKDDWRCGKVVALLLDSPWFQLR